AADLLDIARGAGPAEFRELSNFVVVAGVEGRQDFMLMLGPPSLRILQIRGEPVGFHFLAHSIEILGSQLPFGQKRVSGRVSGELAEEGRELRKQSMGELSLARVAQARGAVRDVFAGLIRIAE